jgi:hypothetical protein
MVVGSRTHGRKRGSGKISVARGMGWWWRRYLDTGMFSGYCRAAVAGIPRKGPVGTLWFRE